MRLVPLMTSRLGWRLTEAAFYAPEHHQNPYLVSCLRVVHGHGSLLLYTRRFVCRALPGNRCHHGGTVRPQWRHSGAPNASYFRIGFNYSTAAVLELTTIQQDNERSGSLIFHHIAWKGNDEGNGVGAPRIVAPTTRSSLGYTLCKHASPRTPIGSVKNNRLCLI